MFFFLQNMTVFRQNNFDEFIKIIKVEKFVIKFKNFNFNVISRYIKSILFTVQNECLHVKISKKFYFKSGVIWFYDL